ncbi:MAG: hypothetical protein HXX10_05295 [Rhodoplanes sp.]|uniref:bestrophin-like domain n=1 Tax=Rhodoplanes sp. TaxID=1968906 RepID=UPI001839B725|nr:hypothetical protein [Rhodoplanes sp.]NVO13434.1 hypothetical protein [Rhodoplanes sp.]
MLDLNDYPLLAVFLVSTTIILLASEFGRRLGVRAGNRGGDNVATLEGAILGLMALMIGFTFAMALARFETRRDAALNEANAIGTTALRARMLPAPHNTESIALLKDYLQLRLDLSRRVATVSELNAAIDRSNAIQEALWQQAKMLPAKAPGMVPTGLYIQSLNEMIDNQEKRLTAARNSVPKIVLLALYGVATIASAFTGYAAGLEARRSRLPVYVMAGLISAVILLIEDLDRPTTGFITVSQQPLVDTASSIAGFKD